ncbi:type III secretion system protein, YscU/HrpY family [Desulfosarcina variabilis str. Montpellier]|uniref:EscU/YscU/HrcU family type III secretion system export apparatus switch protein n=1 Tax=Desulfosarcina variabilis TaxID=2300 RepID=UPI003AFA847C
MKEKTQLPTPKRLRDARKKGQIAKSKEIATCATIVTLFLILWICSKHYFSHLCKIISTPTVLYETDFSWAYIEISKILIKEFILLSVPFAICATIATMLSYMLQFGVLFAFEPIKPDFNRINPVEGFKSIFSWKNMLELIKTILKIGLLGGIIYIIIRSHIKVLVHLPNSSVKEIMPLLATIFGKLMLYVSCVFIFFAILDHFFQKKIFMHKMKMSIDDVKQEYKDREGDPKIKSKRRKIQQEFAVVENLVTRIQKSAVIIADSNETAVAIHYVHGKTKLPIVSAKGKYFVAERIIEIARKNNIPIVHDMYLANKLFEIGKENGFIFGELIAPMANLLRSIVRV